MVKKRWNQKGFTLMEVLVSIAVIGIVFMPMLTFFSHSTQMNIKVKNLQRANTVAQSVVEEFRSYATIQDIVETYWNNEGAADKRFMTDQNFVKGNGPTNIYNTDLSFIEKNQYYFLKEGIKSDGKEYVAKIKLDPEAYKSINDKPVSVISSLASESTVVAKEEDETMNKIREYQRLHFNEKGVNLSLDAIANKLQKTMKIDISDTDPTTGKEYAEGMVHVRVYSEYKLTSPVPEGCEGVQTGSDIYDGLMGADKLKSIYFFYNYDLYENSSSGNKIMQGLDIKVDYKNPANKGKYMVYAVFQNINIVSEDRVLSEAESKNYQSLYDPKIRLSATSSSGTTVDVWTNLSEKNGTYAKKSMEDIVGTERIQRLAELTVEIYNKNDLKKPVVTMTSTRGE